jgi:pimeloyl-ACP methyl ester carboxylesterase
MIVNGAIHASPHVGEGEADFAEQVLSRCHSVQAAIPGGQLTFRIWGDAGAAPLLLLHGGFGSWRHWIHNVLPLSQRYRVLAADLPGLGDSDTLEGEYQAEAIAEAVWSALQQVLEPGQRPFVTGFSFGGIIGCHLAALAGEAVRALVAVAPGALGLTGQIPALESLNGAREAHNTRHIHAINLGRLMLFDPRRIDPLALHLQGETVRLARARSGRIPHGDSAARALVRCRCPIAGIWGERDVIADRYMESRRRLFRSIQPDCPFRVIQGAGHWVMYERPERFNPLLMTLLEQLAARSSRAAAASARQSTQEHTA